MAQSVIGSDKKDKALVAAIDFGTAYSTYAFSFKHDYLQDPTKISTNQNWVDGPMAMVSLKAPTCVLFDKNKQFHSFGYEAEDAYSELALDNDHEDWYYFQRFKMKLDQHVTRDLEIEDDRNRSLPAKLVFGEAIRYLKEHLHKTLAKRGSSIDNKDIHWILNVPAIWCDSAKQFMREATCMSGIDGGQLSIALAPEAALLYCQLLPLDKIHCSDGGKFDVACPGSKCMVIDVGDGTTDITVHERQSDGSLRELHKASRGPWGGINVDQEFTQLVIKLVGVSPWSKFCNEHKSDHRDLQLELETKKRTIKPDTNGKVTIKVPVKIAQLYKDEMGETINAGIHQSPYNGKITWESDKLRIKADVFKQLFNKCSDLIITHIKQLLKHPDVKGTNTFLMVGGFSESPMLHEAVIKAFPKVKVIIPHQAGLAVLRGAVIFGHRPVAITSRRSKYTYGINISPPFDLAIHPQEKRVNVGNLDICRDVFKKYIEEGEDVRVGEAKSGKHISNKPDQREMLLKIYAAPHKNPEFTDEAGVEYLGRLIVYLPASKERITVEVKMMFGETELTVEAQVLINNQKFAAYFDFL